ncbi:MAG TPA: hypothetical protein P5060_02015 [Candidatus Absconditabacterales bacterium]|nr:hypothetical protein [Candidatus Absconditabacterales bacterium]
MSSNNFYQKNFKPSDAERVDSLKQNLNDSINKRDKIEEKTNRALLDTFLNEGNSKHIDNVAELIKQKRESQDSVSQNKLNVLKNISTNITFNGNTIKKSDHEEVYKKYNEILKDDSLSDSKREEELVNLDRILASRTVLLTESKSIQYIFKRRIYFTESVTRDYIFSELNQTEPFKGKIIKKDYDLSGKEHYFIQRKDEVTKNETHGIDEPKKKEEKKDPIDDTDVKEKNLINSGNKIEVNVNNNTDITALAEAVLTLSNQILQNNNNLQNQTVNVPNGNYLQQQYPMFYGLFANNGTFPQNINQNNNQVNPVITNNIDGGTDNASNNIQLISTIEKMLENLELKLENKFEKKYNKFVKKISKLKTLDIEEIRKIMEVELKKVELNISNDMENKLEEVKKEFIEKIEKIEKKYDTKLDDIKNEFEKGFKELTLEISELKGQIDNLKSQLEVIKELQENANKDLKELKEKQEEINTKIDELNKKIEEISGQLKEIQEKLEECCDEEKPIPPKPIPPTSLDMNAVISDMGTDVHREKVSLKVEEELRDEYKKTAWFNIPKRACLFLSRGAKRKRRIRREMNAIGRDAFTSDSVINSKFSDAADRHELELQNSLDSVTKANTVAFQNQQVNALCEQYLQGNVNDSTFETQFNAIIAADAGIQSALDGQDITHIGTNILLKLQQQRAKMQLNTNVEGEFNQYIATGSQVHLNNIDRYIENYIKTYQTNPDFMKDYEAYINAVPGARNRLQLFLKHQGAVMKMQAQNVRMNIDILVKGKSAYQIDNKDRQKNWKYKVGNFLDKLPRWIQTAGFIGVSVGTGLLTGGLGTVAAAAITTGVTASSVGGINAIKKYAHHTKEQNTHEKNVVTDYRNEQKKIAEWQNQALNGRRYQRKTYKAKRQLALYDQTTQENISITHTITDSILDLSSKIGSLTPQEENYMKKNLIEGWTRLKYYRERGHNFLASNENNNIEKDFKELEKSLILGLGKVGLTNLTDIETISATDDLGNNLTYDTIEKDLRNSYDKSLVQFKRERRNLAIKYGIGTAALSAGMSVGMQYVMGTGIFSGKGTPDVAGYTFADNSTENFDLGKHDLLDVGTKNDIYNTGSDIFSNPKFVGSEISIEFGAGTDATPVVSGNFTDVAYGTKFDDVIANIEAMDLSSTQKKIFTDFIKSESFLLDSGTQVNDNLHGMRCLEFLEQTAQSLSDSGNSTTDIKLSYNPDLNVQPEDWYDATERVVNANYNVDIPPIDGKEPSSRGTYLQAPLFFNTFKDKKLKKR